MGYSAWGRKRVPHNLVTKATSLELSLPSPWLPFLEVKVALLPGCLLQVPDLMLVLLTLGKDTEILSLSTPLSAK